MKRDAFINHEFGYLFVPRPQAGLHGHARLEIHLADHPSLEHFDPEQIVLTVKLPSGTNAPQLDEISLYHPWTGGSQYGMSCGHIFISDRTGKKVDAFTFGGEVDIQSGIEQTTVVFESPAPIFEVTPINPLVDLFVDEVEILLAMRRAEWLTTDAHKNLYEERLALADPVNLYTVCLLGVETRLARVYDGASEKLLYLRSAIRAELRNLQEAGLWLGERKRLEEVI